MNLYEVAFYMLNIIDKNELGINFQRYQSQSKFFISSFIIISLLSSLKVAHSYLFHNCTLHPLKTKDWHSAVSQMETVLIIN